MTSRHHDVYLLRSVPFPQQTCVGFTDDLETRFKDHNRGASVHTVPFKPWALVSAHAFAHLHALSPASAASPYLSPGATLT
jgi:predicted GIY-YIG superfamily endonuclease